MTEITFVPRYRMPDSADFLADVEAARHGDEAAKNALFDRFYPVVQRIVHRSLAAELRPNRPWLGAMFSTGDVVQEVFLSVLRDLESFEGATEGAFVNYLVAVTKHRVVDAIRFHEAVRRDRRREASTVLEIDTLPDAVTPADAVVSGEEVALFCSALAGLPQREQILLRERVESGTAFPVLAEELGYPSADAARKAFYAAQAKLVVRLRELGVDGGLR